MYLKSLEIQGFKSFPTQTRLTFDKPITAVVGPNGSGKSNIADAVLWVMGEQSTKTLRGGKMEDIIFGGTLRRPQQNFAEVSLILDNTDGSLNMDTSEVMLTRRYYRSGESEYYINQSLVRLKDITELLMDTGLGNEGYCVIGQGRISEILSAKSKDRRDIFEEAAGISRYKHKKEEAERKLQGTEENLVRIADRIFELENQIEPLREQAEVAKRYNLLSGELRGVEISLWLKELVTIDARIEKAKNDHLAASRQLDAASIEQDEVFQQQNSLAEMTALSEKDSQNIHEQISGIETKKSDTLSEIAVYKSQLEGNARQIEDIRNSLKTHEEQHDDVGEQISDSENRINAIVRQKNEKDNQIASLEKELEDVAGSSGRGEEEHKGLIIKEQGLQSSHNELKSELSALAAGAQELYDSEQSIRQKIADLKQDLNNRKDEHNKLNSELSKAQEEAGSLENIIKGLTLKAESRAKKAEASGSVFERLSSEYKALQSRQTLLSEMEKEYQGYSKSVKMVMQEHTRGALRNIHGTVGSLIKTDDCYTIAIETSLGGALQNIIVSTEEDAKAAIGMLKRRDGGRATFQPISTVKGNTLDESEFSGDDGFVGLAINLIKYNEKYSGIYKYLLGRVIICEDINSAISIARKHNHRYKIVTLDGQVMNTGGSITGGSAAGNVGVLSRANELSQLDNRIKLCRDELSKAEREHAVHIREKTAAEYECGTAGEQLRIAFENIKLQELEKIHREQNIQSINEIIDTHQSELNLIENRLQQNSTNTTSVKSQLNDIELQLGQIREKIEIAIADNELLKQERERITGAISLIRAEISALDAEKDAKEHSVANLRNLREEMSGNRQAQINSISKLEDENETIKANIQDKELLAQDLLAQISALQGRLTDINTEKLEIEAKRNSINKEIQNITIKHQQLQSKVSNLEGKIKDIQNEESLIIDRLWHTYELSRSAAESHGTPIENVTAAKKRINSIKRELDGLGVVNIGAIAEFERVNERYEYYTTRRDDVEKAKAELVGIINEITSRMREIFVREFEIINESFKRTFKELFDGGRASLILEDPEDVLNCGIEIEVQPPGKSVKNITLLSGGEKAFVAIAIYFAILSVRPPPFVVMDEIDAALDDANVVRFSRHMRYMSEKTQMIVITHKRGTMEEADVLYGITMQELGVSNIVYLDLVEAEQQIKNVAMQKS